MRWFERLTTLDATFLHLERRAAHMHVGALAIFEGTAPPFRDVLARVQARLDVIPRYRQRLAWAPIGRPAWIDDDAFDLEYHVRQTALPSPGDDEQLKKLAGRLVSQRLDRDKPLWELWLIEGLSGGRFALLSKTHHCVILTIVAMALRELLASRGEVVREPLRVMVPVSVRTEEQRGRLGNQVTAVFCALPVDEADPLRALARVCAAMRGVKESGQAIGARTLSRLGDFAPPTIAAQAARLQALSRFFNLTVTNVPGPQFPLYLLGRKLSACFPAVPLAQGLTLGVALLSYNGVLGIGLLGDADRARDLPLFGEAIRRSLESLEALARAAAAT
jgi:hypothetical protein